MASRTDAAAMADAFLSSLGLGQSDGSRSTPVAEEGSAATPVAATIAPPATEAEVLGKPMDIFKVCAAVLHYDWGPHCVRRS